MIAVIFEVVPDPAHKDRYLEIAASIRSEVEKVDGFISIERFQSLTDPDKLVSLSYFRDEEAVIAWRNLEAHRRAHAEQHEHVHRNLCDGQVDVHQYRLSTGLAPQGLNLVRRA